MKSAAQSIHTWGTMIKFSHSIFALPFAVLATFLAARPTTPTLQQLLLIVVCMVAARSAAMTFNRIADAKIDAANPRTANRPIPAGHISPAAAWLFFALASLAFIAGCAGFYFLEQNPWPLILAIPVLLFLMSYSYTKRFTRWSHVVLGLGIAFAPVAAWIAINPATLNATAWCLMAAVTFWIAGFDLIYACQDVAFDRDAKLHSVPSRMGIPTALNLARIFHFLTIVFLIAVGQLANLGTLYFVGVGLVAILLIIENAIVKPNDLSRVNLAFFTINGAVGLLLGILGVCDILLA